MKRFSLLFSLLLATLGVQAQVFVTETWSSNGADIHMADPITGVVYKSITLNDPTGTVGGGSISTLHGFDVDEANGRIYAVVGDGSSSGRYLVLVDTSNGNVSILGALTSRVINNITYNSATGQILGVTGNADLIPSEIVRIDTANGSITATGFTITSSQQNITYAADSNVAYSFYNAGGLNLEKINLTTGVKTAVPLPAGFTGNFTYGGGCKYLGENRFLLTTVWNSSAVYYIELGDTIYEFYNYNADMSGGGLRAIGFGQGLCPSANIAAADSGFCPGETELLLANPGAASYEWYLEDSLLASTADTLNADTEGDYYLFVDFGGLCRDESDTAFFVNEYTVPVVTLSSADNILCPGETQVINGTTGGTLQWFRNGVNTGMTGPNFMATMAGTYNQLKTNMDGCSDSAATGFTLNMGMAPTASFTADAAVVDLDTSGTVQFTNASTNGTSFAWTFGDGGSSTAQNPSHTYTAVDTYTVTLVVASADGCTDTSTTNIAVIQGVSRNPFLARYQASLFPNPASGQAWVQLVLTNPAQLNWTLTNLAGQLLAEGAAQLPAGQAQLELPVKGLPTGVYSLNLNLGTEAASLRLVVAQ